MTLAARTGLDAAIGGEHVIDLVADVSLTEPSGGACVLCTSAVPADDVRDALPGALDVALPASPGVTVAANGRWASWLTPRSWLVSVGEGAEEVALETVARRFPDHTVHASRYRDSLIWLARSRAAWFVDWMRACLDGAAGESS